MCGNFGLLLLNQTEKEREAMAVSNKVKSTDHIQRDMDPLDISMNRSLHEVSRTNGIVVHDAVNLSIERGRELVTEADLLAPSIILEAQTAATEIRGGQAGGYSAFEYERVQASSLFESKFSIGAVYNEAQTTRVRSVARKRHPLAKDLARLFSQRKGRDFSRDSTVTVIGHTRFATSSINTVPELHPHEWVSIHKEEIWAFNNSTGIFENRLADVVVNITHNGDFDALEAYGGKAEVDVVGLWLERVLHTPNSLKGDSPKVAGCMDLFRVQGRWAASARLAWVRVPLRSFNDVCSGEELSKAAHNSFPTFDFFLRWETVLSSIWRQHINNIIQVLPPSEGKNSSETRKTYGYTIDRKSEKALVQHVVDILLMIREERSATLDLSVNNAPQISNILAGSLHGIGNSVHNIQGFIESKIKFPNRFTSGDIMKTRSELGILSWDKKLLTSFVATCVRGFLRADLYNCMVEFLSRAEGSFGLQVHSTLEPGVVVIGSKGQPMSVAFDSSRPVCLFASEASALAVPVDKDGHWLKNQIDLDSHGEIMRIGEPRSLFEGCFKSVDVTDSISDSSTHKIGKVTSGSSHTPFSLQIPNSSSLVKRDSHSSLRLESDAFALLNDKISVHEKLRDRRNSNSSVSMDRYSNHGQSNFGVNGGVLSNAILNNSIHGNSIGANTVKVPIVNNYTNITRTKGPKTSDTILMLNCGIELRSYSLPQIGEISAKVLLQRSHPIKSSPLPYDPSIDLVQKDLHDIPSVLASIDKAWAKLSGEISVERVAGISLAENLVECMRRRLQFNLDTIDLLIAGIEVSLWIAEQFAADLRAIFPQLNVVSVSANKLLSFGNTSPGAAFFPGSDSILPRKIDQNTCAILISQSGQTFPSLHATRNLSALVEDRLWIITGCFNSKMENVLIESYVSSEYGKNRIINNYSGHRPAEPSSVAAAATWHTLTHLFMCIIEVTREKTPQGRVIHPWDYEESATKIQMWYRFSKIKKNKRLKASVGQSKKSKFSLVKSKSAKLLAEKAAPSVLMLLSDGCISDMEHLITDNVISNIESIVGMDRDHQKIDKNNDLFKSTAHSKLVARGEAWGDHIREPWTALVLAGVYIFLSVGLGLPIIGLSADLLLRIILSGSRNEETIGRLGVLAFTPRFPHIIHGQGIGWTLVGLLLQLLDGVFFIYVSKIIVWIIRLLQKRPIFARHGKRTIVIVDNPCIHQLAENFCSKLFAQGYSFLTPEVHGASGADHFVHRFTHRVVRGLLILVGRPDGRISSLSKTEASVLLSAKQAAFIRNPEYPGESSGPEIVTIGHNPYEPSLGLCHNITLQPTIATAEGEVVLERKRFIDEYIFDRCVSAQKPFTGPILRSIAKQFDKLKSHHGNTDKLAQEIPYGSHQIDPQIMRSSEASPMLLEYITQSRLQLRSLAQNSRKKITTSDASEELSDGKFQGSVFDKTYKANGNPGTRLAFLSRLDTPTLTLVELQIIVQHFYECRIASLERYIAYCVMFHAMAKSVQRPWLRLPWDIARSQSNLRVSTTASPISALETRQQDCSKEVKDLAKSFALKLRGYHLSF